VAALLGAVVRPEVFLVDALLRAESIGTTLLRGRSSADGAAPRNVIAPVSHTSAHFPHAVQRSQSTKM
jgi:hypothetical protein